MVIKKHKIVLDLDNDSLKELRKVLFVKGVSVQGFISYIVELISIRDPRMDDILEDVVEEKRQQKNISNNKADADTLYHMIEQELRKKQNNTE